MMIGKIIGKSSTNTCTFLVESDAKKFQYIQAQHSDNFKVLGQIVEITKEKDKTIANCNILGYRDEKNLLKNLRKPLDPGTEIEEAEDQFIQSTLGLKKTNDAAYIGSLEGKENINVYLDLNKLLTKHVCILAKSGSGKSFTCGVLLEEILNRNVPIIIFDPHGEHSSLAFPSKEKEMLKKYNLKPKGFKIQEYTTDIQKNPSSKSLKLSAKNLTPQELMHILPTKLSNQQMGIIYSALKNTGDLSNFDELISNIELEENNAKWTLINVIEYLKELNIFSKDYTSISELIRPATATIINLKGVPSQVQEVIAYKLISDLFMARKQNDVPPFFLVMEEAHNFIPERNFGEAKSSNILRQVASEGRKFGLGLCVISQRPVRLDKNIISQCTTQIILKLTNPNDLRTIGNSVEGITSETEKEIRNLHIGTAMVVGVVDMPLFIDIRPRMTEHGGEAINILETFSGITEEDLNKEVINIIPPTKTKKELEQLTGKELNSTLIPCYLITCKDNLKEFHLLVNVNNGQIITDTENVKGIELKQNLGVLSDNESKVLKSAMVMNKKFTAAEIFAKSGLQFSEIYDVLNILTKKNYLRNIGNDYKLSNALGFFLNLNKYSIKAKPNFIGINFDKKASVKFEIKEILNILSQYTNILNYKETHLIKYDYIS